LAKRLSQKEKDKIVEYFIIGKNIDQLSREFNCTKLTISRNLKKSLGEEKYKEYFINSKVSNFSKLIKKDDSNYTKEKNFNENYQNGKNNHDQTLKRNNEEYLSQSSFIEITPLNYEIEDKPQKALSSISIADINFPKMVYMIVDKRIELEIKYLKDYPDWQFLSEEELNRKTIEIYNDLKIAKSFCNKEEKVIKVPNTDVFKIVAPILLARGISRIVNADKLIAL